MGPCVGRRPPRNNGLIAGSYAFSTYVNTFAAYQKTYGSLGAVAVLMTWLWVAAYSILAGAKTQR
ncbi:YhjD/YihY/BrkB family envelope integrity protein [Bradyrhizobium canariense]|uniref:YhjD/YihY/BrkB family envelope integrity protein n=1 Tax=Bradyrhizobium canariense TaxID=255045 RepID=UPI000A19029D|nr:hypothetical protein BST65_22310 [Bradyrhizobium canariense]OSI33055.1 hypothetical protein BST66_14325 [Bradyrhizobium canariense]OSI41215.1 hypothetical protein BSZ20_22445 [Bradyrhizobium canariense]OSI46370.1 hypothetical protein BST67_25220 [Bradyrhizobium canariense]OSI51180.1 hypothetical protein BSZ15_31345 [Bradyrhizobium canariense]